MGSMAYRNIGLGKINSNSGEQYGNIVIQEEDNFSILETGTYVWNDDEFYFKTGDSFPTQDILDRANLYKTVDSLYKTELDDAMQNVFTWNDMMRDIMSNQQIKAFSARLPDHKGCTEAWVDLIAAKPPRVDGTDSAKILKLSNVLANSNLALAYRSGVRGAVIMYGNKPFRVDKLAGGNVKAVELPVKCWIPFVNANDVSTIEVNVFFNIYQDRDNSWYCEFICYYEHGGIKKYKFEYYKNGKTLGDLVEEVEYEDAFDGKGISPIVVFTGFTLNGGIIGESLYKDWDAAITSSIRAYEALMVMIERAKEITRVVPADANETDDYTGITYLRQAGALAYKNLEMPPKVEYVVPVVNMEQVLTAYNQTLERLARDTGLSSTFFNLSELKSNASGETLKASMYRTELKSKSICTILQRPLKELIYKMGIAAGLDIGIDEFDTIAFNGFIQNLKEQMEIVQSRLGSGNNIKTMSIADAIAQYDDVPMSVAVNRYKELAGIKIEEEGTELTISDSGGESEVTGEIAFTPGISNDGENIKENVNEAFVTGPNNINGGA